MDVREKLVEQLRWWSVECDRTNFGCQARKLLVEAADYIAHGVTVQEWISVKDRLPDKRGEYLCYYKFEPDSPDVVCENTYQGSGLWLSEMDKVTHWQHLPQPPKGETIYCKDCENLMFSDCYGECAKGHKGIVNPNDTCEHAKRKPPKGE